MTRVDDVIRWLEVFAPTRLAEEWDNVGLLWGDPGSELGKIMTCLTVTSATADEAIAAAAGLIVSHHPVLFRGAKRVTADHPVTGMLWRLAAAGVSIYSPHTAFDNTVGGINDGLARRLCLTDVGPLRPGAPSASFKIVVFTPRSDREAVLEAAFATGAGRIGAYDECSFTTMGFGTFFGTEAANPTVGQAGRRETVREQRIEVVCPSQRLAAVLAAIRGAHSYEEPAIDVYPLQPVADSPGAGRIGSLQERTRLDVLAAHVAELLNAPGAQIVGDPGRPIERVAIVCGAGDDFLEDAAREGADLFLTGEARYHHALEAAARGLSLIVAGHHATERPGVEDLAEQLASAFPTVQVWPSRHETDPLRRIGIESRAAAHISKKEPPGETGGKKVLV
jgi:dinuclear metal center YbgI/SA1388 family protein